MMQREENFPDPLRQGVFCTNDFVNHQHSSYHESNSRGGNMNMCNTPDLESGQKPSVQYRRPKPRRLDINLEPIGNQSPHCSDTMRSQEMINSEFHGQFYNSLNAQFYNSPNAQLYNSPNAHLFMRTHSEEPRKHGTPVLIKYMTPGGAPYVDDKHFSRQFPLESRGVYVPTQLFDQQTTHINAAFMSDKKQDERNVNESFHHNEESPHPQQPIFKTDVDKEDRMHRMGYGSWRPDWMQRFCRPLYFLVIISLQSFLQGLTINGLVNVALQPIERRYGATSLQVGFLASVYDVSSFFVALPISYFGGRMSRPRIIGMGILLMSLGSTFLYLPHFLTLNKPAVMGSDTAWSSCDADNSNSLSHHTSLTGWLAMLYLGQFLNGIGATPLWCVVYDYIDKSVSTSAFIYFVTVFNLFALLGPAAGYMLGGYLVGLPFNDLDMSSEVYQAMSDEDLNNYKRNPNFIGAYWLGFLVVSFLHAINGVLIMSFPAEFPQAASIRKNKESEVYNGTKNEEREIPITDMNLEDLKKGFYAIIKNPLFWCLAMAGSCEAIYLSILSSFGPKIMATKFNYSTDKSSFILGLLLIPGATLALILGSLIPKYLKLKIRGLLVLCAIASFLSIIVNVGYIIDCDSIPYVGPNSMEAQDYVNLSPVERYCNVSSCNCQPAFFDAFCLNGKVNLFSPCYFACEESLEISECGCFEPLTDESLTRGPCSISEVCGAAKIYGVYATVFFSLLAVFLNLPSAISAFNRSMSPSYRSLAFGMDQMVNRLLGFIPGPLIMGWIFDQRCEIWETTTEGEQGGCLVYEKKLTRDLVIVTEVTTVLMFLFFFLPLFLYKRPDAESKTVQGSEPSDRSAAYLNQAYQTN